MCSPLLFNKNITTTITARDEAHLLEVNGGLNFTPTSFENKNEVYLLVKPHKKIASRDPNFDGTQTQANLPVSSSPLFFLKFTNYGA